MNDSNKITPEEQSLIDEDLDHAWQKLKPIADIISFPALVQWWYELEINWVWYMYPAYKDAKKNGERTEYDKRYITYSRAAVTTEGGAELEKCKIKLSSMCQSTEFTSRDILKQMSLLHKYAFIKGMDIAVCYEEMPFDPYIFPGIKGIRREILRRCLNGQFNPLK